jgi:hypothetical protein
MKYLLTILMALLISGYEAQSQSIYDAARYSNLEVGGTARTVGIGGAIGALGADFSVLSTNPAGLAAYRRSEFVFTPTWELTTVDARLEGSGNRSRERERTNFNFNSLGLVFAARPRNSDWKVSAFGIGLNRMANFYQQVFFEGTSPGSITDRWLELADGYTPDELDAFEAGVAYEGEAIYNVDPNDNTAYTGDFEEGEMVEKSQLIRRKGSINELVFSFAGNYDEKILIGATLGVPFVSFEETKTYMETDDAGNNPLFNELKFRERLRTTGTGVNLKLGLIYRLSQMVRLGFAFHTPTGFALDDSFSTSLDYSYVYQGANAQGSAQSPDGNFEYKLRTPWRFIGSAGMIFDKQGFLSAEVEWVDYTNARFNFNKTDNVNDIEYEQELNDQIGTQLGTALNIRLGGEFAYKVFRFRGGYSLSTSPLDDNSNPKGAVSVGAGYRGRSIYLDFAYRRLVSNDNYLPYVTDLAPQPSVSTETTTGKFMLTVGFRF